MAPFLVVLSEKLHVSVLAYDYSGYGRSTGARREAHLYRDIDAAWRCLREQFGVPADRIVLYGQSIGTVPTVDLAARLSRARLADDHACAGVVLHSPLMSGASVCRGPLSSAGGPWLANTCISRGLAVLGVCLWARSARAPPGHVAHVVL